MVELPMARVGTIVWFRKDLRLEDNPALASAARSGPVLPVFIWCPEEEGQFHPGRVSRWWLKQSLSHLDVSLRSLGAPLTFRKAKNTLSALLELVQATGATHVVYNHLYDPISLVRDHQVKQCLIQQGVQVQSFKGNLLYEPWEIRDGKETPFTTFDAFWQKSLAMPFEPEPPLLPPRRLMVISGRVPSCTAEELGLEDSTEKDSNALLARAWSPGWSNADGMFESFLARPLYEYGKQRQKIDTLTTSLLSPHLHFGEISIRKVFHSVRRKQVLWTKDASALGEESANLFLRSIGFREYSRYLCFNFPFTHEKSLLSNLKFFPWRTDESLFKAWRQGRTGYPLVDAGMRELWATGWLHNRVRVIVASFCVKFLQLPWRWGMKYFWDTLLDADLESDVLGWQYISGSLPDGHKLDRMDNPQNEGYKYDPNGEYVRKWLPELARVPTEWIHHPWDAPPAVLRAAGVELGCNYPRPIVDIVAARGRLMHAVSQMWQQEAASRAASADGEKEGLGENMVCRVTTAPAAPLLEVQGGKLITKEDPVSEGLLLDQMVPIIERPNKMLGAESSEVQKCAPLDATLPQQLYQPGSISPARNKTPMVSTSSKASDNNHVQTTIAINMPRSSSDLNSAAESSSARREFRGRKGHSWSPLLACSEKIPDGFISADNHIRGYESQVAEDQVDLSFRLGRPLKRKTS